MKTSLLLSVAALAAAMVSPAAAKDPPHLLRHPSLSASAIAFDYAGAIWSVPRGGGEARMIAAGQGNDFHPVFSPDGSMIAFTAEIDGNVDVYVVAASGGEPRRLTWHPGHDEALGWSADGKSILIRSDRALVRDLPRLYLLPVEGGDPVALPLPSGNQGALGADGRHLAYSPFDQWQPAWKQYRGGQTARIWIADLADSAVVPVPRDNSNDTNPMMIGNDVWFLSDRDGPVTLYRYDAAGRSVHRVLDNARGFGMASAAAGPGGIVIDHFGALELYDTASNTLARVPVTIHAERAALRPHFRAVEPGDIAKAVLSPSGKRVVIEARGEVLSVPAEKGDARNLTQSPGVADRDPALSPDGKRVAWFSDESGEYALKIGSVDGLGAVQTISLGSPSSFFYAPQWSPDSQKIVFSDKRLKLWWVDLAGRDPHPVLIATDRYDSPDHDFAPAWSPDSKLIAYTLQGANYLHTVMIHALDSGKATALTDTMSDSRAPVFDPSGDFLYFIGNTSRGLGTGWLDMSSLGRASDASVYAAVLRKGVASPVAPQSDEENDPADKKDDDKKSDRKDAGKKDMPKPVVIDYDGLDQRIVALALPRANYVDLKTAGAGVVLGVTAPVVATDADMLVREPAPQLAVQRYENKTRKTVTLVEGVDAGALSVSADGKKLLYARKGELFITGTENPAKPGEGAVHVALQIRVDPRAEYRQMYHEVWRIERDFLYDPHAHGLDLARAEALYRPFVDGLGSRGELNVLIGEMTGHIGVGHTFVGGGDNPAHVEGKPQTGLLGADFDTSGGQVRFARVYRGENWNPDLAAPLTQPGAEVREGEYLIAVNGRPIDHHDEVYRAFDGLAGKQTVLTVAGKSDGSDRRDVRVVPIASDTKLRLHQWMDDNRRLVDRLSGGRIGYVYLPDTASGGFANFNRYYFAQVGKQGMILDERFNHGGDIADYIVDQLKRTPQMINSTREGEPVVEPAQAIFGPKVMIINQMSGSGGDALPWLFKKAGIGPLVGKRTWGGLVGIGNYPPLIDGGGVTAPRWAIYGTKGEWEVENIGIAPDIDVEADPAKWRQGHDAQLEAAVAVALDALAKNPPPHFAQPPAPDKHPVLPDTIP